MLKKILNLFKKPAPDSSWGNYQNTRLIGGGWQGTRPFWRNVTGSIRQEVSPGERRVIISASNRMFWNFGPCHGGLEELAQNTIGRHWFPRFEGKDRAWGKLAEDWLNGQFLDVAYASGLNWQEGLYLDVLQVKRDGDCGTIYGEAKSGYPQFQQVPWHSVGTRDGAQRVTEGAYKGKRIYDGVILNEYGRAIAFNVLGETADQDRIIPSQSIDWLMDPRNADQVRGLPAFTSSILDLKSLITLQGYTEAGAQIAASIGLIETNETGFADPADPALALGLEGANPQERGGLFTEEIAGGTIRYIRANSGAKLQQLEPVHESEATSRLMDRLMRQALLGAALPPEWFLEPTATGAGMRAIVQKLNRTISDCQDMIRKVARRRISYAVSKAIKMGILPEYRGEPGGQLKWSFVLPPALTVDEGYQSQATRESYKLGFVTLSEILGQNGRTLEAHLDEREAEELAIRDRMDRSGLPESAFRILTPNGNPDQAPATADTQTP
jgi:hypothetical protein